MTLFLRDKNNFTIVDIEIWESKKDGVDLSVSIDIENYSKLLLSVDEDQQDRIVELFTYIDNLREWVFEIFLRNGFDEPNTYQALVINVRRGLTEIAEELNLCYCED